MLFPSLSLPLFSSLSALHEHGPQRFSRAGDQGDAVPSEDLVPPQSHVPKSHVQQVTMAKPGSDLGDDSPHLFFFAFIELTAESERVVFRCRAK